MIFKSDESLLQRKTYVEEREISSISINHTTHLNHLSNVARKSIRSRAIFSLYETLGAGTMQIRKVRRRCNDILAINRRPAHRAVDKLLSDEGMGSSLQFRCHVASLYSMLRRNYVMRTERRACRLRGSEI